MGCIYCATNQINGKIYIGKTISTLNHRKAQHKESKYKTRFTNAIKKYGFNNFKFEALFESEDEDLLNYRERILIKLFDSQNTEVGYNITDGGEGVSGHRHSEESKKKMSESAKKPKPHKLKPIEMFDFNTNEKLNDFKGITLAAKELKLCRGSIDNNLKGVSKYVKKENNLVFFKYKKN